MLEFAIFQSARTALTIALGIYLAFDLWRLNRVGPAFAIQQMRTELDDRGRLVVIHGRQTGFLAWIYTRLGLEADARLELTADDIRIERQSLKGFDLFYAPTHDLSSSKCSYYRAVSLMLIAVSLLIGGYLQLLSAWRIDDPYQQQAALTIAGGTTLVAAVGAVIAFWLFEISKRISISVETSGGEWGQIAFKRNVIDNVTVGLPQSVEAVTVLNRVILQSTGMPPMSSLPRGGHQ